MLLRYFRFLDDLTAGTYTVKDVKNARKKGKLSLIDPPLFTIDLGADQKICEGMTVTLNSPGTGTYTWTSDNGFTSTNQNVQLTQAGIYTLIL